ncbi:hypothetical protein MNB_SV-5-1121 [hydrothermal vent metagenome]|uniref:Uncharacterized protein n=1 Tax=hydrothermal vent metagenome TaxID=652676 RepID=A0A1W1EEJ6_9ZZZZ
MLVDKFTKKEDVVAYINAELKDYEGYVQFSHRPIDIDKDIFYITDTVMVNDEKGFIFEAHFFKEQESIMIRQQNAEWIVDKTLDVPKEVEIFSAIKGLEVKMSQMWEAKQDEYCENMEVMKLQKVVFSGFAKEIK